MVNKPTHNGPGRGSPRTRAVVHPRSRSADSPRARTVNRHGERSTRTARHVARRDEPSAVAAVAAVPRLIRGVGFTRRVIVVLVVVAALLLSFGSSLRVYLRQERELATAQQQIAERTAANAELAYEVERWRNPDFVKAQARERLGWVVPGEVGYRVVDAEGRPVAGGVSISSSSSLPDGEHATTWWDRLSGSIEAADQPLVRAEPTTPVVTVSPAPTPSTATKKR